MKSKKIMSVLALLITLCVSINSLPVYAASSGFKAENQVEANGVIEKSEVENEINTGGLLSYVDYHEFNSHNFVTRLPDDEKLNTYVFQNVDNTKTIYYFDENVKYVDKNGEIVEKDLSLVSAAGGYTVAKNDVGLHLPIALTAGISVEYDNYNVTITPVNAQATSAVKDGEAVLYAEAFGTNTALRYTPLLSGVKEDIILSQYIPNAQFVFTLNTDGLYLFENNGKYYLAESESSAPVYHLGDIVVYDKIGKPSNGTMTVEAITAGEEYRLTVSADEAFLTAPETVYPVTIDPSITVSDSTHGSGAIQDAPIFSGYPSTNCGTYVYNRVGTPSADYGKGRTVVKLSGLISSSEYVNSKITSVKFYAKECSGSSSQYINLYPLTSNTTWTESNVTWNNVGSYSTALNCGNTMYNNQWTAFDITSLVNAWKNGTYNANAGFIMVNQNESNDKCFYSSEIGTAANRPYVVMTYESEISLNYSSLSMPENTTKTLVATTTPNNQTVTWSTNNSAIISISPSGVVSAKKAGTATVTARIYDSNGNVKSDTCTVDVYIPNGVYYIKNLNSNNYLHVKMGGIANLSDVYQYSKYSDSTNNNYKIRQMWKTYYLGNGRYSIRPMNKLDMGLDVTNGNVDIYNIGITDSLSNVPNYCEWTINWYSTGYVFKNNGIDNQTMQIENASTSSGTTVVASNYSTSSNCRWGLTKISSPPAGAYLYDTSNKSIVTTATRAVDVGSTKSLSTLQLSAVAYSGTNINQSFTWYSSDNAIATVDSNGAVTGVSSGKATITGHVYRNSTYYYVSYTICVGVPFELTMTKLSELYDVALEYDSTPRDAALLTMQFIRRTKYNDDKWNIVAGAIDSQFVDYVETNYPLLYRYFTVEANGNYYYLDPNGEGYVDFIHLCATMNGLLYDSEGFEAAVAGEANINNLCGWAGDLQTLCIEVLTYTNNSNNYDTIYNATYDMIGDDAYSLSMMDLLADTDAYNVYRLLNSSSSNFISAFTTYYNDYVSTRYTRFTNGWSKQKIYDCVRNYTTNTFFLWQDWPLLAGYDITDTQADAIASAFTDFVWEKIQNE